MPGHHTAARDGDSNVQKEEKAESYGSVTYVTHLMPFKKLKLKQSIQIKQQW